MSSRQHPDIQAQTKNVIFNVYTYFKNLSKDSSHPEVANFFIQAQQKTSEACGISLSTIRRITSEGSKAPSGSETGPRFTSPRKTYKRIKYATDISDFDKDVLRRTVHAFYDQGEFPTSVKILSKFKEKTGYKGSKTSLWRILKLLNFSYRKCIDGRRFIMEQNNVVDMREQFLRKMVNFRQNNDVRQVVYLDELDLPIGKHDRLIICKASSTSYGFVNSTRLDFRYKSDSSEEYYQTLTNSVDVKDWFITTLHDLKEPSVIIMDNAWYNWVHSKSYPKSKEVTLQKWLIVKGIEFSPLATVTELHKIVEQLKPKGNELSEIALSMGHEVVQLPQYHFQYNPLNLVWAEIKEKYLKKKSSLRIDEIERWAYQTLNSTTIDEWKTYVTLSHKQQDDDYVKEVLRDKILKSLIKTTNPDDSSECEDQNDNS